MSNGAPRLASLAVLGGPFHGRRVDLGVVDEITIGSDPGCSLVIDLPSVSPLHAKVWVDTTGAKVHDTRSTTGVFVNMDRVETERPLREGDTLWLGPPEEPGSVLLQCRFERAAATAHSEAEPLPLEPMGLGSPDPSVPPPTPPATAEPPVALSAAAFQNVAPAPAPAGAPPTADFVVAGFEAQWPETKAASPAPPPTAAGEEDPFFIGEDAQLPLPPAAPTAAAKDDPFFIDDFGTPAAEQSRTPAEPLPASAEDFFFGQEEKPAPSPFAPFEDTPFEVKPLPDAIVGPPALPPPAPPPPKPEPAPSPESASSAPASPARVSPPAKATPAAPPAPAAPSSPTEPERPPASAPGGAPAPSRPPAAARRPEAAPAARRPPPAARPPRPAARPAPRGRTTTTPVLRYAGIGAAALVVLGVLGLLATRFLGSSVRLDAVEPGRGRGGQTVTLTGSGFADDAKSNTVLFGDKPAAVLSASATRLEVAVPEVGGTGEEARVPVRVSAGRGSSNPLEFTVLGGPTIHGISPDVAMPGEEVVLAGAGWGFGAAVRFGTAPAEVLEVKDTSIRVRVPAIAGGPGTAAPAVVSMGATPSNELPFFIGSVPLVLKVEPAAAAPGDLLIISGRGFQRDRARNAVLVAGAFALVVSASDGELKAIVPTLSPGEPERPLEVRVAGLANVGRGTLSVPPLPETVELRLVPQTFDAVAGRDYAVLATDLGPAFVLAGSGGRTAADRAVEAQRRLDEAVTAIQATRGLNFEARALETSPVIGLAGRPEVVLEVTEEDARAYDEDWTGLRGKGGPISRARLARWWEAVARDLVLLIVRGERPQFAAALAPEGRALADVYQAAQKTGRFGVARDVVTGLRAPQKEALRLIAFRVPASVTGPAITTLPAATVAGTPAPAGATPPSASAPLRLEGSWIGSEEEGGERRYLTASFRSGSGTVAYEGIVTLTVPLLSLETPQRGNVRFSLQFKGGIRYYAGRWDGQRLSGTISRDPAGASSIGTFELRPR